MHRLAFLSSEEGRPRFYLRAEVGLNRLSSEDNSVNQWGFGGAAGVRIPTGDHGLFRLEGGVDKWLKKEDDFVPGITAFRFTVGVSAMVH